MLEIASLNIRKFEFSIEGRKIRLLPPKMKTLKKIIEITKRLSANQLDTDGVSETVAIILNRNDDNIHYTADWVDEHLDIDDAQNLLDSYVEWIGETQKNPNFKSPAVTPWQTARG